MRSSVAILHHITKKQLNKPKKSNKGRRAIPARKSFVFKAAVRGVEQRGRMLSAFSGYETKVPKKFIFFSGRPRRLAQEGGVQRACAWGLFCSAWHCWPRLRQVYRVPGHFPWAVESGILCCLWTLFFFWQNMQKIGMCTESRDACPAVLVSIVTKCTHMRIALHQRP
jgi:hypothetical protein